MTSTIEDNLSSMEEEIPFGDADKIVESAEIQTDDDRAAEEARKEEIRRQMTKVRFVCSVGVLDSSKHI